MIPAGTSLGDVSACPLSIYFLRSPGILRPFWLRLSLRSYPSSAYLDPSLLFVKEAPSVFGALRSSYYSENCSLRRKQQRATPR